MADVFDASPRPAIERLARIEGQSNFLSMLANIEVAADTTEDMGALAFARTRGCVPEVLEANIAQSDLYRLPLMSVVWHAVLAEWKPKEKDWPWIQGAIADAFLALKTGHCKPLHVRAKRFKVDISAYSAMRKTAGSVFAEMADRAQHAWHQARKSETTSNRHTANERGTFCCTPSGFAALGCYRAGVKQAGPDDDPEDSGDEYTAIAPGMADRLSWDDRNAAPSPVLTIAGDAPE